MHPVSRACLLGLVGCAVCVATATVVRRVVPGLSKSASAAAPAPAIDTTPPAAAPSLSLLLIGNSHSAPLPALLRQLAAADGVSLFVDVVGSGGFTLAQHAAAPPTLAKLHARHYDVITLQEQGQLPAWSNELREQRMYPAGSELARAIRAVGAAPWVYAAYARPDGDPGNTPGDTYEAMQSRSDEGYAELARRIDAKLVPVGSAFRTARALRPELALWNSDGVHASPAGFYLTACTFYAVLLHRDPTHVRFDAGLPAMDAAFLRGVASGFVR